MNHCAHRRAGLKRSLAVTVAAALLLLTGGCSLFRKTVFYVNSYHEGHGPSDGVMAGIRESLRTSNVHLRVFMMDAGRYPDEELIQQKVEKALFEVSLYEPDVMIVSDDAAVKHFLAASFAGGPVPCVFCGVDWRCDQYGLPTKYVTGMLEVAAVEKTISTIEGYYPDCRTVFVIAENSPSERRSINALAPVYRRLGLRPSYALVDTYEQWKERFIEANASADLVYLSASGAIGGWDSVDAGRFVEERIKVPVLTCDQFMMPYAVFGLTKVPEEQGEWAAKTALQILAGKKPKDIPVVKNTQTKGYLNISLAEKIGFKPDEELLSECQTVQ